MTSDAVTIPVPHQPGGDWVPLAKVGDVVHYIPIPPQQAAGECCMAHVVRVHPPELWQGGGLDSHLPEQVDLQVLSTPPLGHRSVLLTTAGGPPSDTPVMMWARAVPVADSDVQVARWHAVH